MEIMSGIGMKKRSPPGFATLDRFSTGREAGGGGEIEEIGRKTGMIPIKITKPHPPKRVGSIPLVSNPDALVTTSSA